MSFTKCIVLFLSVVASASALQSAQKRDHIGDATWTGRFGVGDCGISNSDSDLVVGISPQVFDSSACGKKIKASYEGKEVKVTVTDRCETCRVTDLDFSPAAFNKLADTSMAKIRGVKWDFE